MEKVKVENYRKQEFRDKVYHIATERGWNGDKKNNKIKFNFNHYSETAPITICGTAYKDCVAYFYTIEGRMRHPQAITYNDIVKLERKLKLSTIEGKDVQLKKEVKVRKNVVQRAPKIQLEVGKYYGLNGYYGTGNVIKITRKTPKQFKFVYCDWSFPIDIQVKSREAMMHQYQVYERAPIEDCEIRKTIPERGEGTLKLSKDGNWISGNSSVDNYVIEHFDWGR